jgi:hypothetical protein
VEKIKNPCSIILYYYISPCIAQQYDYIFFIPFNCLVVRCQSALLSMCVCEFVEILGLEELPSSANNFGINDFVCARNLL